MASVERKDLTPAQARTVAALGAGSTEPVRFPSDIGPRLRSALETELEPVLDDLGSDEQLVLSKHLLSTVHGCEVRFVAEDRSDEPFVVTVPIARGTVAHKAIELGVHWKAEPLPMTLVDEAMARLVDSESWLAEFLQTCTDVERAELRSEASDRVSKFFECFPPLRPQWRPVTESTQIVDLLDGRIRLRGKVDLTLGAARADEDGTVAGKVVIDLKTGGPNPLHRDDLRFYALLDAVRLGTPPRLVASFYLDMAEPRAEPVTEALLESTVARTVDGAVRLAALRAGTAAPVHRPSPACRWCSLLPECEVGSRWLADDADPIGYGSL